MTDPVQERSTDARLERLAVFAVWLVPVLWTVNLVIARKAPALVGPYTLALGRWFLAALVLLAFVILVLVFQKKIVSGLTAGAVKG